MTHRFLVSPEALDRRAGTVSFAVEQAHQLRHVLRLRPGDRVRVFDGIDPHDWLTELGNDGAHGQLIERLAQPPEPRTCVVAYPALLPRDTFESVLPKLVELGVARIVPLLTTRTVVREAPDEPRLGRWRRVLREAAEQCRRGVVPGLGAPMAFAAALAQAVLAGTALVAYEGEHQISVHDGLAGARGEIGLFVGPEGGFSSAEVTAARAGGARLVTLGPRVLRAETASPTFAALVLYELGELSSEPG